jgi:hypothetical protein
MTSYRYTGLATPTSIRLLVVSGSREAPSYAIEDVDLNNKPRFEALSYTWRNYDIKGPGVMEADDNLYIAIKIANSGLLHITTFLGRILQEMHDILVQPELSGRLWVDQISINQQDLDERSHQVSLMHRVYGQAERTLLWLGACDEHTPAFLDLTRRLNDLPLGSGGCLTDEVTNELVPRLRAIFRQEGELHLLVEVLQSRIVA